MKNLRERCFERFQRVGVKGDYAKLFREIEGQYEKPKRYYHTFYGHIGFCLNELETVEYLINKVDQVEMALLFHDIVMDFTTKDNEKKSADYAFEFCRKNGLNEEFAEGVHRFVMVTKHNAVPEDEDARIIIDIDFSILGQNEEIFKTYEHNIRKEYKMFSDEEYRNGRSNFLKGVLANRPDIFLTGHFRKKYKTQAHQNLENLIAKLSEEK